MKQFKKLQKEFFSQGKVIGIFLLIVAFQPWIDLDYLLYPFLDQYGLPRPSTLIRFVIIPLFIIYTFWKKEQNKKKTLLFGGFVGIVLFVYFYAHIQQASQANSVLNLTDNFQYSLFQELSYVLTMILPYGIIYALTKIRFNNKIVKVITGISSIIISFPILISDLFVFGQSTYLGMTEANLFSWFTGIYETVEPRRLACKFFFDEGNTIGILLFMILPLLYYFFSQTKERKEKVFWGVIISVQSCSMLILSTRVASLGAVLIPVGFCVLYLFDCFIMKNQRCQALLLVFCAMIATASLLILPMTPAIQNQKYDTHSNDAVRGDDDLLQKGIQHYEKRLALTVGSKEYEEFCLKAFEKSGIEDNLISSLPKMYYVDWYNYKEDPVFWSDLLFTVPLEDRLSGRQFQTYFMNEKWAMATKEMKLFGMGYTPFMNGSILLEKDFVQQKYTFGWIGNILLCGPWLILLVVGGIAVLLKWKKCMRLEVLVQAMALCCGIGAAYMSGHTLDQFVSTTFMALLAALLIQNVFCNKEDEQR